MFAKLDRKVSYQYLALLLITLIAAALRFYKLGEWSFWIEEHHSLRHALNADPSLKTLVSNRMPFYLVLKLILSQFGATEWTARLLPAVLGTATVPFLFLVVRKLLGFRLALLASAFLALSPWHLYWSQNVRFYTLLLLAYTVSLFSFYWGIEKDRFRYILLSVAGLAAAGSLHLVSALLVPIFILYYLSLKLLPWEKPAGLRFRNLLPVVGLPFIGFAVLEAIVWYLGERPLSYSFYLRSVNRSTAGFAGLPNPYAMLTAVVYYIGTPAALLSLLGSVHLLRNKQRIGLLLTLGSLFPLALLSLMTLFASTSNRYAFMTLACWVILAAVGVNAVLTHWRTSKTLVFLILAGIAALLLLRDPVVEDVVHYSVRDPGFRLLIVAAFVSTLLGLLLSRFVARVDGAWIGGVLILLVTLIHPLLTTGMYYRFQHGHRADLRAAAATIKKAKVEGEVVYASPPSPLDYYLGQKVVSSKSVDLNDVARSGNRFWVLDSPGTNERFKVRVGATCRCDLAGNFDLYTAGRSWKARVYLCEPKTGDVGIQKENLLSKGSP